MDVHVQCDASLAPATGSVCQLYVGHDGDHAALVIDGPRRLLRRWQVPRDVSDVEFTGAAAAAFAWAPGHPSAAVAEPKPSLSVVAANPGVLPTMKTGNLHIA